MLDCRDNRIELRLIGSGSDGSIWGPVCDPDARELGAEGH